MVKLNKITYPVFWKPTLPLIQTKQAFSRFEWQNFTMLTGVKHVSHFFGNKNIRKLFSQNFWRIDFQWRMWKLSDKLRSLRSSCRLRGWHKIRFWHWKNKISELKVFQVMISYKRHLDVRNHHLYSWLDLETRFVFSTK